MIKTKEDISTISIEMEILEASYIEHYKYADELARYLPLRPTKRVLIQAELNKIGEMINKLKNK